MAKKLVAVHDKTMFMFADVDDPVMTDKCIVYNKDMGEFAPELRVGCWTARMNPWEKPTDEQIKEADQWLEELNG